jgi:hypothetical protein
VLLFGALTAGSIEEERFFPFVEQRARMPLLFSEQHGVLDDSLDLCDAAIANMAATGTAARDAQLLIAFKVRRLGLLMLLFITQSLNHVPASICIMARERHEAVGTSYEQHEQYRRAAAITAAVLDSSASLHRRTCCMVGTSTAGDLL